MESQSLCKQRPQAPGTAPCRTRKLLFRRRKQSTTQHGAQSLQLLTQGATTEIASTKPRDGTSSVNDQRFWVAVTSSVKNPPSCSVAACSRRQHFERNMQILLHRAESKMMDVLEQYKKEAKLPAEQRSINRGAACHSFNILHQVFNDMLIAVPSAWACHPPDGPERTALDQQWADCLTSAEKHWRATLHDGTELVQLWKKGCEEWPQQTNMLYHGSVQEGKCFVVAPFPILAPLHLDDNWDKLTLQQKGNLWQTLSKLQTLTDVLEVIPDDLMLGITQIWQDMQTTDTADNVSEMDAITFAMIKNDIVFAGIAKFVARIAEAVTPQRSCDPPASYSDRVKKARDYCG